jgi:hypothetical protein
MRTAVRPIAVLVAGTLLLALSASVVARTAHAKEWLEATLDAPIAMDTPAGTEILVGVTVVAPGDDGTMQPVVGSPIRLILTGRNGATTFAAGAWDGTPGHYSMRITIPDGGARRAVVAMHGTSDLPLTLMTDPFAFGGITPRTAQVAPPLAPPITPFPRASSAADPAAPVEAASAPGPAAEAPAPPSSVPTAWLVAGVVIVALAGGIAVLARARSARRMTASNRAPGG